MQKGEHGHVVDVAEEEVEGAVDDGVEAFVYRKAETAKLAAMALTKKYRHLELTFRRYPAQDSQSWPGQSRLGFHCVHRPDLDCLLDCGRLDHPLDLTLDPGCWGFW